MPATMRRSMRFLLVPVLALAAFVGLSATPATTPPAAAATMTLQQHAVQVASWQKGKPYEYGAAGPYAFDCSGLTKYVYGRLGHWLPHSAYGQYLHTVHLTHAQLRPGDLVFVNTYGGGASGINHVGIYAGSGYWWVARHTGTVITRQWIWTSHYWVGRVRS